MSVDTIGCLTELNDRGLLPTDVECAFASGSVVRGWGNQTSDLDIYVVSPEPWTGARVDTAPVSLDPPTVSVNAFYVDEQRWDVEYWQTRQVRDLFAKVSWAEYDEGGIGAYALGRHEVDFLERIAYAVPLHGPDWLDARKKDLRECAFRTALVGQRLNFADIFIEDAVGQMQAHDYDSAVLSARMALGNAIDALTASYGELGQSTKWRARRLRAVEQDIVPFEDYWRVETMQGFDPADPAKWVREAIEMCQRIAVEVQIR